MPCDRDFGIIKKRKRVGKHMVPEEIAEMIAEAPHAQPFNAVMMKEDFYDISAQCDIFLKASPIQISTASRIKISRANLPTIHVKTTFSNMEPWKEHNIFKRGRIDCRQESIGQSVHSENESSRCGERFTKKSIGKTVRLHKHYYGVHILAESGEECARLQQDGAMCHTSRDSMEVLTEFFDNRAISKGL
ncbi:uncharacterized protein TNCV_3471811 [Trichonephila clavipes]|nr:uncharacterized protein TNCV_3471811 [Trichonephila clavipes]